MSDAGQQMSEEVVQRHEWLRVALSSIGDAVIATDRAGRISLLNPVAETLTGWKHEDAVGLPLEQVFKIVNEDTRQTVENPATRALREGLVVGLANHTLLIAKDGTEQPIDDSAAPMRNPKGDVAGVILVFRGVGESRKAEKALRESEERFRLLVEGTRDYAIFMLDPKGIVASWNAGAERIKGYRAEQIIGKHFSCFYPQEAIVKGWPDQELEMAKSQGRFEDVGWRVRQDGSRFWANVIITPLRDETGNLRGFSKITRDLTERRQLERAKLQAEIMADVNRRKDEFLAILSHELRNPLSPILNAVHLLRLGKSGGPLEQQALGIIERQIGQLTRLVDDLLEVSRITTGRIRLQREAIDMRAPVERALETARRQVTQRKHELSVTLPPEPIWLFADSTRIEQVVVNLLVNAAKYTPEGGRIWLTLQRENEEAVLRVRDTGIGIAPDFLPRMFELFTQAERSLDHSQGGLGVGLTVVRRVAEFHGGRVEAHSKGLGHGSEFIVRLPVMGTPATPPEEAEEEPAWAALQSLRVLVVDDNKDAAITLAMLVREAGHDARTANDGPEALQAASDYRPDVVLLDIGLPGMNGHEVAKRLRQQPAFQNVTLVALTGYGQETDRQNSVEAGFNHHLVKPAAFKQVQEILTAATERRSHHEPEA